jgi:hypothetical protein
MSESLQDAYTKCMMESQRMEHNWNRFLQLHTKNSAVCMQQNYNQSIRKIRYQLQLLISSLYQRDNFDRFYNDNPSVSITSSERCNSECYAFVQECHYQVYHYLYRIFSVLERVDSIYYENTIIQGIGDVIAKVACMWKSKISFSEYVEFMKCVLNKESEADLNTEIGIFYLIRELYICVKSFFETPNSTESDTKQDAQMGIQLKETTGTTATNSKEAGAGRGEKKINKKTKNSFSSTSVLKPSKGKFISSHGRKHGKAILNKWRKLTHDRLWTMGFTRQSLVKRHLYPFRSTSATTSS